jgi:hypothetical protein
MKARRPKRRPGESDDIWQAQAGHSANGAVRLTGGAGLKAGSLEA